MKWCLSFFFLFSKFAIGSNSKGFSWKSCRRSELFQSTIPFDSNGTFKSQCAPDTLYTWQECWKVNNWVQEVDSSSIFKRYVYTWRTPLGTHGYGKCSVRFKLKKNVQFRLSMDANADCSQLGSDPVVWVHYIHGPEWTEYVICNPNVIHSWSFGTREHLEEMQNELNWISTQPNSNYDIPAGNRDYWATKDKYPFEFAVDINSETDWTWNGLNNRINFMKESIGLGNEKIFFARDVTPNREDHFDSKTTGYFHPDNDFIKRAKLQKNKEISHIKASWGLNLGDQNLNNASLKANQYLNLKSEAEYKISNQFLDDPDPSQIKSFDISWQCGDLPQVHSLHLDPPSGGKILKISCLND